MGYSMGYKGYKMLDLQDYRIYISRHVEFHESIFPFLNSQLDAEHLGFFSDQVISLLVIDQKAPIASSNNPLAHAPVQNTRPHRAVKIPSYLADCHCYLIVSPISKNITDDDYSLYPISNYVGYSKLATPQRKFVLSISSYNDPTGFTKAAQSQLWCEAWKLNCRLSK